MRYVKTDDYDSFVCLAGACGHLLRGLGDRH